jgi:1-acyl-sn-glycerol-3-phosphate acyltransferase
MDRFDQLPGAAEPRRRLPVTPGDLSPAALRARARAWRWPSAFPLSAPTWPGAVTRPPPERTLGTEYDSEWARRYPARLGRVVVQELLSGPVVQAITAPRVEGLDRIAHLDEPAIFAANHSSHLDAPLLLSVIPERWRHRMFVAGAADYFFDTRAKAVTFAFLLNAVPIERQRVSRDSANRVAGMLAEGWSLLIFPEGGRSQDGWAQPHRPGTAWLAVRSGRPVVPVYVEGTRLILPRGSSRLRPGTTRVTFGRPLRPAAGEDSRALADRLERSMAALADEQTTDWWTAKRRAAARTSPTLTGPEAAPWRRAWALGEPRRARRDRSRAWSRAGRPGGRRDRGGRRWPEP